MQFLLKTIAALIASLLLVSTTNAQNTWEKVFGGSEDEEAYAIHETSNGGYIVAGFTESSDGDVHGHQGEEDVWVLKLNINGDTVWTKTLGGSDDDLATAIDVTSDGGYILTGYSKSTDGDVTNNHGQRDVWVVKLNSNGAISWQKSFGGSDDDEANAIEQTSDGGYIVAGDTKSDDGDVSGHHGGRDYWVLKLNSNGDTVWTNALGGNSPDGANDVKQTSDGGYIVAGASSSQSGDVHDNIGQGFDSNYWLVKLNSSGDTVWTKSLGGTSNDVANSVIETDSGNYIIVGQTKSKDVMVHGSYQDGGLGDGWVVKTNSTGDTLWTKVVGGTGLDVIKSVAQSGDSSMVMSGFTGSTDGEFSQFGKKGASAGQGESAFRFIANLYDGLIDDLKEHGGNGIEELKHIFSGEAELPLAAVGLARAMSAGYTESTDIEKTGGIADRDFYVIGIDTTTTGIFDKPKNTIPVKAYPNPFEETTTIQYSLQQSTPVELTIYNLKGEEVKRISRKRQAKGEQKYQLNLSQVPAGTYFYELQTDNGFQNGKLLVVE